MKITTVISLQNVIISIVIVSVIYWLYSYFFTNTNVIKINFENVDDHPALDTRQVVLYSSYNNSYYNDNSKKFVKLNAMINERFCSKHYNHTYKQFIHEDTFMSPYWLRVYDLYNLCKTYPDNTIFMYLDADAIIKQDNISIHTFLDKIDKTYKINQFGEKFKDIYISHDPNIDMPYYTGIFNTGCYIVRNTKQSREYIKKWLDKYNNGNEWKLKQEATGETKWECRVQTKNCDWSADGYEQGEFSNLFRKNDNIVQSLHWTTLACTDIYNKHCYVLHMMQANDRLREKVFTEFLKTHN